MKISYVLTPLVWKIAIKIYDVTAYFLKAKLKFYPFKIIENKI